AADGADAEVLPRLLLGAEERLRGEDLGIARPRGAAALHRVRDVHVVAGAQEEELPPRLAAGLRLPSDAGEAAAVPAEQGIARLGLGELGVAPVHLLYFEVALWI